MSKLMTIIGMVLATLVVLLFAIDLAIEFPFKRANVVIDVIFILCGAAVGYMSWTTMREQV